jgi:hypothetical protein
MPVIAVVLCAQAAAARRPARHVPAAPLVPIDPACECASVQAIPTRSRASGR